MRFFLNIFFLSMATAAFAQQDTLPEPAPLHQHELYFGVNLGRLFVKDYEVQVLYRVNNREILGISGGYDLNGGEELFTDTKAAGDTAGWYAYGSHTDEGQTRKTSRYFFGKGAALRLSYEYLKRKKGRDKFVTTELLLKFRNYDNYYYQEYQSVFLESASQKIYGLSVYYGKYIEIEDFLLLKSFIGFGFRYLQSNVVRPGHLRNPSEWIPENRFNYNLAFPMLHLGISLIINPASTGSLRVVE